MQTPVKTGAARPLPPKNTLLNINGAVFRVSNVSEKRGYIGLHYLGPAGRGRAPYTTKEANT